MAAVSPNQLSSPAPIMPLSSDNSRASNVPSSSLRCVNFTLPPLAMSRELFPERLEGYTPYQWAMAMEPPLIIPQDNNLQLAIKNLQNAYPSYVPAQTGYVQTHFGYTPRSQGLGQDYGHGYGRSYSQSSRQIYGQSYGQNYRQNYSQKCNQNYRQGYTHGSGYGRTDNGGKNVFCPYLRNRGNCKFSGNRCAFSHDHRLLQKIQPAAVSDGKSSSQQTAKNNTEISPASRKSTPGSKVENLVNDVTIVNNSVPV
ncbi:uncharacterized protein DFL_006482 [Arthrobotrys flagrans]|uniref:C3H1-type domain-containing protein n=1 Tax=Arthrobotrys flagrans TaxID=97331 RepID=A0A437A162_ARTFL|nr:hypothetical protein DFL_006482 [Arthrobotrys flagrans]